jgi:hypothetical protein
MNDGIEETTGSAEQNGSTPTEASSAGRPSKRHGCPIWCSQHPAGPDDHHDRTWHLDLQAWALTATPHAWEDRGFPVLSTMYVMLAGSNADTGETITIDLDVNETRQLAALLLRAADDADQDAKLGSRKDLGIPALHE